MKFAWLLPAICVYLASLYWMPGILRFPDTIMARVLIAGCLVLAVSPWVGRWRWLVVGVAFLWLVDPIWSTQSRGVVLAGVAVIPVAWGLENWRCHSWLAALVLWVGVMAACWFAGLPFLMLTWGAVGSGFLLFRKRVDLDALPLAAANLVAGFVPLFYGSW